MKKIVIALLIALSLSFLGLVFWVNRALYFSTFDAQYWVDKFEHSQWRIPQSHRVIGDDGLYLYQGYRLIKGGDPTTSSAEVPPLGKYLIGLSIHFFGNGYWYGYIVTAASIIAFFFLANIFLANPITSMLLTLAVAADPMIASQFRLTMLDSLQLFFLETTLIFFLLFLRTKRHATWLTVCAGLSFGLFSCTKFPLFSPFFAALFLFFIWKQTKKILLAIVFVFAAVIGYLLPYLPYFFAGHSFIEWMKVQKYIISFYLHGYTPPNFGSLLTTLLFNRDQNIFSRIWEHVPEWSLTWPIVTACTIFGAIRKKINPTLLGTIAIVCIPYIFIPFWTRYLVVILPLLYLGAFLFFKKPWLAFLLIAINVFFSISILFPTPETTVKQFAYDWEHGFFQDMYESLAASSKKEPRAAFHRFGQITYYDAEIEAAHITLDTTAWSPLKHEQNIPVTITYITRQLGAFKQKSVLPVINEQSRWHIRWSWDMLLAGLTETSKLQTTVQPAKRGSIIDNKNRIVAQDHESFLVWITPGLVEQKKEDRMNHLLQTLLDNRVPAVAIHNRYVENAQQDLPIPISVIMKPVDIKTINELQTYKGITLTPAFGRFTNTSLYDNIGLVKNSLFFECCSLLYTTTSYDGVSGLEKQYNDMLKGLNGGSLELVDEHTRLIHTFIHLTKKDGASVQL